MLERLGDDVRRRCPSLSHSLPEDATVAVGLRDRFVGKALALMHERPDHAWTVDDIPREVGLSCSALHGESSIPRPSANAIPCQLAHPARRPLLRDSNRNVATIALDVGYDPKRRSRVLSGGWSACHRQHGGKRRPVPWPGSRSTLDRVTTGRGHMFVGFSPSVNCPYNSRYSGSPLRRVGKKDQRLLPAQIARLEKDLISGNPLA